MGKEGSGGELWDDSALLNAFDDAMSKYKKMHSKKIHDRSTEEVIGTIKEDVSVIVDESREAIRAEDENNNGASDTVSRRGETNNLPSAEENQCIHSCLPEPYIDSSNGLHMQDTLGYSYSQGAEDYNQLLGQYYELEEKRQKILQQLHQFSASNYQYSVEGSGSAVQWGTGTCTTSQEHPVSAGQASYPTVICSCCPYACQSLVTQCTSCPACSLGGLSVGKNCGDAMSPGNSLPLEDVDIVKTAMEAAEKAISSTKMKTSVNSNINEEKENEGEIGQNISSETDLTVVLNAWYSAGFYTGKYLTEQSFAKRRQG